MSWLAGFPPWMWLASLLAAWGLMLDASWIGWGFSRWALRRHDRLARIIHDPGPLTVTELIAADITHHHLPVITIDPGMLYWASGHTVPRARPLPAPVEPPGDA